MAPLQRWRSSVPLPTTATARRSFIRRSRTMTCSARRSARLQTIMRLLQGGTRPQEVPAPHKVRYGVAQCWRAVECTTDVQLSEAAVEQGRAPGGPAQPKVWSNPANAVAKIERQSERQAAHKREAAADRCGSWRVPALHMVWPESNLESVDARPPLSQRRWHFRVAAQYTGFLSSQSF